jgi:hypothetical protein
MGKYELPYLYWIPKLYKNSYKETLQDPVNALPSLYLCSSQKY